jgi:hypothetical protein
VKGSDGRRETVMDERSSASGVIRRIWRAARGGRGNPAQTCCFGGSGVLRQ